MKKSFTIRRIFLYSSPCLGVMCSLFFAQKSRLGRLPSSFHDCTSSLSTRHVEFVNQNSTTSLIVSGEIRKSQFLVRI